MKAYESMKSSNVLWLGDIPKHWELRFLEQTCHEKSVKNIGDIESNVLSLSYGYIIKKKNVYSGLVANDFSTYQIVQNGDIILRFTDLQNDHKSLRTGLVTQTGIITSAYTCITPTINSAYLRYLLHSYDLRKVFYGMGGGVRQSIGFKDVRHMFVPVPPRNEQDQIVRFLDWKVSEINRLINVKHRQIELLEELKKTVVSRVVTRGLNADVKMKDSGVNWIGDIPEHWEVLKLKRVTSLSNEKTSKQDAIYIGMENVLSWKGSYDLNNQINPESVCSVFSKGNILFGKLRPYLAKCIISDFDGICSSEFLVLKNINCNKKYLLHYLLNPKFIDIVNSSTYGAKMPRANWNFIGNQSVTIPPIEEQQQIVAYLDEQMQKIEAAIANKQKQIEILQELKTRLISDVVTGKIDVRGVEIPDYEYVEEESDESLNSEEEPEDYKENN